MNQLKLLVFCQIRSWIFFFNSPTSQRRGSRVAVTSSPLGVSTPPSPASTPWRQRCRFQIWEKTKIKLNTKNKKTRSPTSPINEVTHPFQWRVIVPAFTFSSFKRDLMRTQSSMNSFMRSRIFKQVTWLFTRAERSISCSAAARRGVKRGGEIGVSWRRTTYGYSTIYINAYTLFSKSGRILFVFRFILCQSKICCDDNSD